jgi:hypothetical protein
VSHRPRTISRDLGPRSTSPCCVHQHGASHLPASFRPQAFSTSRRITPRHSSRASFIPQPKPGSSRSGVLPLAAAYQPHGRYVPPCRSTRSAIPRTGRHASGPNFEALRRREPRIGGSVVSLPTGRAPLRVWQPLQVLVATSITAPPTCSNQACLASFADEQIIRVGSDTEASPTRAASFTPSEEPLLLSEASLPLSYSAASPPQHKEHQNKRHGRTELSSNTANSSSASRTGYTPERHHLLRQFTGHTSTRQPDDHYLPVVLVNHFER